MNNPTVAAPSQYTCKFCGEIKQASGSGRSPVFCSNACRQAHYRKNVTLRNATPQSVQNVTLQNGKETLDVYAAMAKVGIDIDYFDSQTMEYKQHFIARLIQMTISHDILFHSFVYSMQHEASQPEPYLSGIHIRR